MPPREGDLRTLPSQENLAQDEYLENTFISRVQSNTDLPASMSAFTTLGEVSCVTYFPY